MPSAASTPSATTSGGRSARPETPRPSNLGLEVLRNPRSPFSECFRLIRTNLAFHEKLFQHPEFVAGDYDTGFIERHKAELAPAAADDETAALAAIAAAAQAATEAADTESALDLSKTQPSAWRSDRKD